MVNWQKRKARKNKLSVDFPTAHRKVSRYIAERRKDTS
jgi:hypothetical protein